MTARRRRRAYARPAQTEAASRRRHLGIAGVTGLSLSLMLAGCDVFYVAQARVPLVAPISESCLSSAIGRGPERWSREKAKDGREQHASVIAYGTPAMFHNAWETVVEIAQRDSGVYRGEVYRDSSAMLAWTAVRVNRRFAPADATLVGTELATRVQNLREACGGRSPDDEPSIQVKVSDTPYRMWTVPGTHGRGAMRYTVDSLRYMLMLPRNGGRAVLHTDTLASGEKWLAVDSLELPPMPKDATFATECWRGDSTTTGSLVAYARSSDERYHVDVLAAWAADARTMHIHAVPVDGIECLNTDRGPGTPEMVPRALRRIALSFRPSAGQARIYAYLSHDYMTPTLAVDDRIVGQLQAASFLMLEVGPGRHKVSTPGRGEATVWIDAAADSSYFVELRKKHIGFGVHLRMMDSERGRRTIRAADMLPGR